LNEWLNPTDGTTRDWASLQVVFGRGEEYFASDKNGKLEFKEPEVKKPTEGEEKEKTDRQILRRSRTVSFLRPLSQTSIRADAAPSEAPVMNRRTSSISSQRASRPPSLSYSTTGSEASTVSALEPQPPPAAPSSLFSRMAFVGKSSALTPEFKTIQSSASETVVPVAGTDTICIPDTEANGIYIPSIPEESMEPIAARKTATSETCTCGCHDPPVPQTRRPTYTNASVQTDPAPPQPRTSLRVDTFSASAWSTHDYSAVSRDVRTPVFDSFYTAPFSMGRMTNYFSKPGYQLGDSLSSGYNYYEPPVYQYQDEFGDEALG
jgi:hypothetical protein